MVSLVCRAFQLMQLDAVSQVSLVSLTLPRHIIISKVLSDSPNQCRHSRRYGSMVAFVGKMSICQSNTHRKKRECVCACVRPSVRVCVCEPLSNISSVAKLNYTVNFFILATKHFIIMLTSLRS